MQTKVFSCNGFVLRKFVNITLTDMETFRYKNKSSSHHFHINAFCNYNCSVFFYSNANTGGIGDDHLRKSNKTSTVHKMRINANVL